MSPSTSTSPWVERARRNALPYKAYDAYQPARTDNRPTMAAIIRRSLPPTNGEMAR